jgi:tetratricopeptide (TPR) repeat protein
VLGKKLFLDDVGINLDNVAKSQLRRFERLGDRSDLEHAISNGAMAVELTSDGHLYKPGLLTNLGLTQVIRFSNFDKMSDLENAMSSHEKAVALTDDGHPSKPLFLLNLGIAQRTRFERFGNLPDLDSAISNIEEALGLIDDGKPMYLDNLGSSQHIRFQRLGDLSDLENAISNSKMAIEVPADKRRVKPEYLITLGIAQAARFTSLGDLSDLDNAISNTEEALRLTDDGSVHKPGYLTNLGAMQLRRFNHLGDMSNLESAITYTAMAAAKMDNGNPSKPGLLTNLSHSQQTRFEHLGNLSDLESAISNAEMAIELTDDGHPDKPRYLSSYGKIKGRCFKHLGNMSDLDDAISNVERAVMLMDDGHSDKLAFLSDLGAHQDTRFRRLGNLPDIVNAITNMEKVAQLMDDRHSEKPDLLTNLGNSQHARFKLLGDLSDLKNAISNGGKAIELTSDGHPSKPQYLSNHCINQLTSFEHLGNLSDLDDAISNVERAVILTNDGHVDKPDYLSNLGGCQRTRFRHLGNLPDLENSISNIKKAVDLADDNLPMKAVHLRNLGLSEQARFEHFGELEDHMASVSSFNAAAQFKAAYPSQALSAAQLWANISHIHGDLPSALDAYRTVLELLPKVAWLGLDTHSRQDWLLQAKSENMGCLAATCAIQLGHLEEAVELLDLGRSVFWQQASLLRSDLDMLIKEEPELAKELERVGQQLDTGNFSDPLFIARENGIGHGQSSTEDTGKKRRQLVNKWEVLVARVRQLPQLKYFLQPIPFHQLRQASLGGQVVIINVSQYGVDALIFGTAGPIKHLSLPDTNLDALTELSGNILHQQPVNASENQRRSYLSRFLKPALQDIWDDIMIHIFNKICIRLTNAAALPQHRIWWYPTGPLTFIPIHAAGPRSGTIDVSRLVISSYVTTLHSLFQAKKKYVPVSKEQQKLLCVSQPRTPGQSALPTTMEEVDGVVQMFCSSGWSKENIVCLCGSEATVDAVSTALNSCSCVHLACHGFQDPKLGMKSAFALHDGFLELSEIASKKLYDRQFAFLSTCEAASGQKDLPGEAMHLAAGVQFAGFPSVIATMWRIHDEDAPKVAYHTYKYVFRNGVQGLDPSEAATALNHAILYLREDPDIRVDQWAPFIHFGI